MNHHRDGTVAASDITSVDLLGKAAHAPAENIRLARRLAVAGILGVGIATVAIGLLHVMPGSRLLNPLSSTISEYALLTDGWIFDSSVILLAVASALVLTALVVRNLVAWRSWGALMTLVWCVGLVGLTVFPKQGFGVDASIAGRVHWTWTLIAFFSLPIGINLICWQHRTLPGRWRRWAVRLSMVAGGWFAVLTVQTAISALTPIQAWRVVGLVERALSLTEMIAVIVLGLWVLHDSGPDVVLVNPTDSHTPETGSMNIR